ncbi:MAG: hypothetical protein QNJ46_28895 [Leptolyngbyaceae cyanobacterium MO_188.B28]|nr:hypothetical protein [Leptolyngbyaceae cyanobacterium MO_188.B28]
MSWILIPNMSNDFKAIDNVLGVGWILSAQGSFLQDILDELSHIEPTAAQRLIES